MNYNDEETVDDDGDINAEESVDDDEEEQGNEDAKPSFIGHRHSP